MASSAPHVESRLPRCTAIGAAVLVLVFALYCGVGSAYLGFTRVSLSDLRELLEVGTLVRQPRDFAAWKGPILALAVMIMIALMSFYAFGAVLLIRRRSVGRLIVLIMSGCLAALAGVDAMSSHGNQLIANLVAVPVLAVTFMLAWVKSTRGWVGLADLTANVQQRDTP